MKKTLTINLNNTVFHIDEDAYEILQKYLDELKSYFATETDGAEIIGDVEARISELFSERMRYGLQVITTTNVEEIISMLGQPSDYGLFEEDSEHFNDQNAENNEPKISVEPTRIKKRLYRDKDNAIIGGVASGLAAYLNIEASVLRLIMILIFFFMFITPPTSLSFIFVYLIMWIIIPPADSVAQKLEMKGVDPNIDNISSYIKDNTEKISTQAKELVNSPKSRNFFSNLKDVFISVLKGTVKVVVALLGGCFGCLGVFIIIPLLIMLIALLTNATEIFSILTPSGMTGPFFGIWTTMPYLVTSSLIIITLPLLVLCYIVIQRSFKWPPMNKYVKWILFIIWALALIASIIWGLKSLPVILQHRTFYF
ncbi:MAG: PspC domain-containing protein [Bacteroidales bacterium]